MNAYDIYNQRLFARADMLGVPLSGTFELTPRCNFRCKMCYIHRAEHDAAARAAERSAAQWLALAEQCCREGTLMLLLTGGEPLLRPDFREIYTGCKRMGLVLSVNTNASLIDDDMVELFAANPPRRINITLYGASPETYGALCGSREAYARVVRAILNLQSAGVIVKLNFPSHLTTATTRRPYTILRRSTSSPFRRPAICSRLSVPASTAATTPTACPLTRLPRKRCAMTFPASRTTNCACGGRRISPAAVCRTPTTSVRSFRRKSSAAAPEAARSGSHGISRCARAG